MEALLCQLAAVEKERKKEGDEKIAELEGETKLDRSTLKRSYVSNSAVFIEDDEMWYQAKPTERKKLDSLAYIDTHKISVALDHLVWAEHENSKGRKYHWCARIVPFDEWKFDEWKFHEMENDSSEHVVIEYFNNPEYLNNPEQRFTEIEKNRLIPYNHPYNKSMSSISILRTDHEWDSGYKKVFENFVKENYNMARGTMVFRKAMHCAEILLKRALELQSTKEKMLEVQTDALLSSQSPTLSESSKKSPSSQRRTFSDLAMKYSAIRTVLNVDDTIEYNHPFFGITEAIIVEINTSNNIPIKISTGDILGPRDLVRRLKPSVSLVNKDYALGKRSAKYSDESDDSLQLGSSSDSDDKRSTASRRNVNSDRYDGNFGSLTDFDLINGKSRSAETFHEALSKRMKESAAEFEEEAGYCVSKKAQRRRERGERRETVTEKEKETVETGNKVNTGRKCGQTKQDDERDYHIHFRQNYSSAVCVFDNFDDDVKDDSRCLVKKRGFSSSSRSSNSSRSRVVNTTEEVQHVSTIAIKSRSSLYPDSDNLHNSIHAHLVPEAAAENLSIKDGIKDGIKDSIKDSIKDGIKDGIEDGIKDGIEDGIKDSGSETELDESSDIDKIDTDSRSSNSSDGGGFHFNYTSSNMIFTPVEVYVEETNTFLEPDKHVKLGSSKNLFEPY